MPRELAKHDGATAEPRLIRGEIPEPGRQVHRKKRSPWERHIQLAKEFPARWDPERGSPSKYGNYSGGWIEVATQLKGGPKERRRKMELDHRRLERLLNDSYPLDRFQIARRTDPGTWCDIRLYIRFLFTMTPEEDTVDRVERRKRYDAMMAHRREVKAQRELENRRRKGDRG